MVKTILSLLIAAGLLFAAAFGEYFFVNGQFNSFESALLTLNEKVRDESAGRGDAESVRSLWEEKKRKLHAVIPHNDISYIDYWLGEAVSFIESEDYVQALSKIEVLITLCEQIPQTYALTFENIF